MVSYIDFVEERLELGYDYGVVGGVSFNTEIIETGSGVEQRNALWWQGLGRWQLGDRMLLDSDEEGMSEVEYLRQFHSLRQGSKQGFRFKDWADYQVTGQVLGITDGVTTNWQLKKAYYAGSYTTYRPILKPIPSTVKVYLDGSEINYHLVNYATGLVSFSVPPVEGQTLSCDFEFDVPVQFEADKVEWTLKAVRLETGETLHQLGSVFVKEIRIDPDIQWVNFEPIPSLINEPLDLGVILDTTETITYSTRSEKLASGFESNQNNPSGTRVLIKLPQRNFNQQELTTILNYFWVAKGRLSELNLKINNQTYLARFNSDSLSCKFLYQENLFEVNFSMYVLGVIEQCRIENLFPPDAILILTGEDLVDRSPFNNFISSYSIGFTGDRYTFFEPSSRIITPSHPRFSFDSDDFSIEIEAKMRAYNTTGNLNYLANIWADPSSFQSYRFSIRNSNELIFDFIDVANNYVRIRADIPDLNYFATFQCFKVERVSNLINLYYNSTQLISQDIGNVAFYDADFKNIFFGFQRSNNSFSFNGEMRAIVITRPSLF